MRTSWEKIFTTVPVPEWLLTFEAQPDAAVDAALRGRYFFGALNVAEPSDLLIDWALGIGDHFGFIHRLDEALANWIEKNWGKANYTLAAMSWIWLSQIVANVEALQQAPQALRRRFHERQKFLAPLCAGPSRDPLGMYLNAIARHQKDDSLAEVWWDYCKLAPGIPWYHGLYGITGLRGLPPSSEKARGAFPELVAKGVACLGQALYRQSEEQKISLEEAYAEFDNVAHLTLVAYPFPERWRECWEKEINLGQVGPTVSGWMEELVPELMINPKIYAHSPTPVFPPDRLKEIGDFINQLENPQQSSSKSVVVISGIRGIGKTTFLKEFAHVLRTRQNFRSAYIDLSRSTDLPLRRPNGAMGEIVKQIDWQNDLSRVITSPVAQSKQDMTPQFARYLRALLAPGQRRYFGVLLFDSVEESLPALQDWLKKIISTLAGTERLLFVLAHGATRNLIDRLKLGDTVYSFRPKEFDYPLTQQQLQSLGFFNAATSHEEEGAYMIYTITQGHPLATQLVAEKAREEGYKPEDIKSHYTRLIRLIDREIILPQIFGKYRKDEIIRLKRTLTPLAIARHFTVGSMERLIEQFAPQYKRPDILRYGDTINELHDEKGVIRYDEERRAFKVISPLRGVLSANLRDKNRQAFIAINKFLGNRYDEWLQDAQGMAKTGLFLEKVYHLVQADKAPRFLFSEFAGFVEQIRRGKSAVEQRNLLQQSWEAFKLDADLAMLLSEPVKKRIAALFSVTPKRAAKQFSMGGA